MCSSRADLKLSLVRVRILNTCIIAQLRATSFVLTIRFRSVIVHEMYPCFEKKNSSEKMWLTQIVYGNLENYHCCFPQACKFPAEVIQDNIELLLECMPYKMRWEPVSQFIKLGGITLLLQLVAMAAEWNAYTGK